MSHPDLDRPSATTATASPRQRLWSEFIETAKTSAVALFVFGVFSAVLFQPFTIPSSSMEPALLSGDYLVASKFAYGWSRASFPLDPPLFRGRVGGRTPKRGEVVLFRLPRDPRQTWVKRMIGLPGDHIQIRGGVVFVNGRPLAQAPLGLARDHDDPLRPVRVVRETQPDGRSYLTYYDDPGREGEDTGVYVVPQGCYS